MRNVATVATGVSSDAAFGTASVGAHVSISGVSISVNNGGAGIYILDEASWTSSNPAPLIDKRDVKLALDRE